jgi:hypothetical protein
LRVACLLYTAFLCDSRIVGPPLAGGLRRGGTAGLRRGGTAACAAARRGLAARWLWRDGGGMTGGLRGNLGGDG